MHIDTLKKMQSHYENIWQNCLAEVEKFKVFIHSFLVWFDFWIWTGFI